ILHNDGVIRRVCFFAISRSESLSLRQTVVSGVFGRMRFLLTVVSLVAVGRIWASESAPSRAFLERFCFECHDADMAKGGLDLTALKFDTNDPKIFSKWATIHD